MKSCVLLAGLLADGETRVTEPAPSRDHTERMLRAAGATVEVTDTASLATARSPSRPRVERAPRRVPAIWGPSPSRATSRRPPSSSPRRWSCAAARWFSRTSASTRRAAASSGSSTGWAAALEVDESAAEGNEPRGDDPRPQRPARGHPSRRGGGPARDRRAAARRAARLLRRGRDRRHRARPSCATRSPTGSRRSSMASAALGAEIEALEDGFAVRGTGGLRGGTIDAAGRPPPGDARRGRGPRVDARGWRCRGMDAAARQLPGLRARPRRLLLGRLSASSAHVRPLRCPYCRGHEGAEAGEAGGDFLRSGVRARHGGRRGQRLALRPRSSSAASPQLTQLVIIGEADEEVIGAQRGGGDDHDHRPGARGHRQLDVGPCTPVDPQTVTCPLNPPGAGTDLDCSRSPPGGQRQVPEPEPGRPRSGQIIGDAGDDVDGVRRGRRRRSPGGEGNDTLLPVRGDDELGWDPGRRRDRRRAPGRHDFIFMGNAFGAGQRELRRSAQRRPRRRGRQHHRHRGRRGDAVRRPR